MEQEMQTAHEGTTTQRLDRVEQKVDQLVREVADIRADAGRRRVTDDDRLRSLEDFRLEWNTRWAAYGQVITRIFGVSVAGFVVSTVALIATLTALLTGNP
jgi:hypothetical protein